ncbi:hypothetical protein JCM21714_2805 [Gracilibacillus boraciitolerans JCM 21714]|uniref:DUF1850 domain-containing protein n=1 Tax=Gracilibacillus boraciitolerans JCM 21714 TaxID=1298598 RepID=W4VKG4_9BACI|nr:hypothetical protein JCM21714_2805 [Gracilibacillus boraciitolerans JCM 21714]
MLKSGAFFPKIAILIAFIGLIIIGVQLFHQSHYQLVITDMNSKEVLWESSIKIGGDRFSHQYIHSVEKSPVQEIFELSNSGEIVTMESWTKSFGAGLPYQHQGEVSMKDGYYVMRNLNRPIHGGGSKNEAF